MNWKIKLVLFLFVLSACESYQAGKSPSKEISKKSYLIESNELKEIADQSNYKILDFRKKEAYQKGHIQGALNIWRTDIEDQSYPYGGMMASKFQIETLFGNLGIATEDTIVIYDDNGLCDAARLWWILQSYHFHNTKLLNGGLHSWKANEGQISMNTPSIEKTVFKLPESQSLKLYLSKDEMQAALNSKTTIIDTRTQDEFSGKRQKKGASKGGRIPNSINIDWAEAINYEGDKKIKPIEELDSIYSRLVLTRDDPIIVYCHSGVRSAHTTFILTELLGYKNVKNYDGSWIEWSYFNDLPYQKDSLTQILN